MRIRVGCELVYECPQRTPMILVVNVHYSRALDIERPDHLVTDPAIPIKQYRDGFGNWCTRVVAPRGRIRFTTDGVVRDSGASDPVEAFADAVAVEDLPEETLPFLLGSRYCETDRLSELAWGLFGHSPSGWGRVQAICDFVHGHVTFGYEHARPTKTAWETYCERTGVCRDYAHLAVALCRCMNIPARYCTGYLSDIGVPPPYAPDGLRRMVRGLSRRKVAYVRPSQQRAQDGSRPRRPGPRRRGRRHQHRLRAQHAREFPRVDRARGQLTEAVRTA